MKKERMFGKFEIVHTSTSHTDTLWKKEITVDPTDKNAVEKGRGRTQRGFPKTRRMPPTGFRLDRKTGRKRNRQLRYLLQSMGNRQSTQRTHPWKRS